MNELKVIRTQDFMGKEVQVIEGGFSKDSKVILAKTIAEIHGVRLLDINSLINENIEEFEYGIDILDLKNSNDTNVSLLEIGFSNQSIANSKNIYLLSEQGYMLLVGFMRTDKAKEIRKKFRREYFTMRQVIKSDEQLKKDLAYKLLVGGVESIEAHKQLLALETAPLIKSIEGKDAIIDRVIKDDGLYALGTVGKMLKPYIKEMGARKIFDYMRKENILIDNKGCQNHNLPYAKYDNYFEIKNVDVDCGLFNRSEIKSYLNGKGMKFFLNRLVKNGLLTNSQKETVINKL